ncbi:hypothetical protein JTE90_008736 [Oedothorax gibbosus]|uniref:Uncharacterized protein n=1 Tax=Oedothorax gibbosus TaxID=931172 RepID=A0AAV6UPL1_9ARAC|nr:hypothetical protein JTE90_008736 [Oedothorax gibbosus]
MAGVPPPYPPQQHVPPPYDTQPMWSINITNKCQLQHHSETRLSSPTQPITGVHGSAAPYPPQQHVSPPQDTQSMWNTLPQHQQQYHQQAIQPASANFKGLNAKMRSLLYSISFLLTIFIHAVSCEHEYHYNHENDKWPLILSKIEFFWKNKTDAPSTSTTEQTELHNQEGNHWNSHNVDSTTELSTPPVLQNGTFVENVKETVKASLALLIGVPIFGIIVLCCCCYCCLKCCAACCEDSEEGKVIVVQQNNMQQPSQQPVQPTQVILQQPVYQTPVYTMQPPPPQYGPAPPQQWAVPPHHHHQPAAYDNPDYGEPSAPPPQYGKY